MGNCRFYFHLSVFRMGCKTDLIYTCNQCLLKSSCPRFAIIYIRLLRCTLYGAPLEDYPKATIGTECCDQNVDWDHILPNFFHLHWFPICILAQFKMLVLPFKELYGMWPAFFKDCLLPCEPTNLLQ